MAEPSRHLLQHVALQPTEHSGGRDQEVGVWGHRVGPEVSAPLDEAAQHVGQVATQIGGIGKQHCHQRAAVAIDFHEPREERRAFNTERGW